MTCKTEKKKEGTAFTTHASIHGHICTLVAEATNHRLVDNRSSSWATGVTSQTVWKPILVQCSACPET